MDAEKRNASIMGEIENLRKDVDELRKENNKYQRENLDQKDYDYDDDRLIYLIEQIEKNNVSHLTLQGGEPLMNPKIISLLQKLSVKETA